MANHRAASALAVLAALASSVFPQMASAQSTLKLIPMPREVHALPTTVPVGTQGLHIVCATCSADDQFAANDLTADLTNRHIPSSDSGFRVELTRLNSHPLPAGMVFDEAMRPEGYIIAATPTSLTVIAATPEGVFYGAQTIKQLIAGDGPRATLTPANIRDWPAMKYRGLDDDLSRGPFPTLDFQKKQIRILASLKLNIYSMYFENTMQYTSNPIAAPPGGFISPEQARELVAYARPYHITIIPEQEAFGHLHKMLEYDQYSELAETQHGAVLAPGQPGSTTLIQQMFSELAAEYPGPFLHLGADETVELGTGQTKPAVDASNLGTVYLNFMQRIVQSLQPLHRKLLFWGDIAYHTPDLVKAMPQSFKDATIAVPWTYNPEPNGFDKYIRPFTDAGFETWVAPGVNNWSRVFPENNLALLNIQQFTRDGQRLGCDGQLNTIWNDDGEGLENQDWYGIYFGAAAAWQHGESSIPQFESSFGQVFHGDLTGDIDQAQVEFIQLHSIIRDQAKLSGATDNLFWMDPWAPENAQYIDKLRPYFRDLRLHAEHIATLVAQARAAALAAGTPLREQDALDAIDLGARRADFIFFKFEMADEMAQNYRDAAEAVLHPATPARRTAASTRAANNAITRSIATTGNRIVDLRDNYSALRDQYAEVWLSSNRPYYLSNILARYDHAIQQWMDRADRIKSVQSNFTPGQPFPTPRELGMPESILTAPTNAQPP